MGSATSSCLSNVEKTGDDEGNGKEKEQRPRRNMDHITCNDCVLKGHYDGTNYCPTKFRFKEMHRHSGR